MVEIALAFLLGDVWVQHWSRLPTLLEWSLILGLMFIAWRRRYRLALALLLGVSWASVYAVWRLHDRLAHDLQQRDVRLQGYVASVGSEDENRIGFDFVVTQAVDGVPKILRLNWYHPRQPVLAGQGWQVTVRLKPPHGRLNPGGFDYEAWLFANAIGATGYVKEQPEAQVLELGFQPGQWLALWRRSMAERIERLVPESHYLGIIQALTLGEQRRIDQAQWRVFRDTGVMHLIVISGSHISLVAGLMFFLVRKGWSRWGGLRYSPQNVAVWVAGAFALVYAALAGFSIPTQRALVMLAVVLFSWIGQRHVGSWHALALALLAVLCFDPLSVLSVGFWLSFFAVAVLLYASSGRLGRLGFWREAIHAQWVATLGLSPLLIACFQQVSLISPLANWVAVPWVGLILVPLCLLGLLLSFVSSTLASSLLNVIDWQVGLLYSTLEQMAAWPWAILSLPQPSGYVMLLSVVGVCLMLAPRGFPGRHLGLFLLLPLLWPRLDKPEYGEAWLTLLDVGQGLSAVIQTTDHLMLFDTGASFGEHTDMAESVVLPYLRYQGIKRIDHMVISHGDNDHSGGATALLAAMPVTRIFSSVAEFAEGDDRQYCRDGQQWEWDGVSFIMLGPGESLVDKENDSSCVLKMIARDWSALLTGDIEQHAESWLVQSKGEDLSSDVLVAPHHGSKTSSSLDFLRQIAPKMILVPAGYSNRFGFPHREVLARYRKLGLPWKNVGEQGAMHVVSDKGQLIIESQRTIRKRYWMHDFTVVP